MINLLFPPFWTASATNETEGKKPPGKIHFWIKSTSRWSTHQLDHGEWSCKLTSLEPRFGHGDDLETCGSLGIEYPVQHREVSWDEFLSNGSATAFNNERTD